MPEGKPKPLSKDERNKFDSLAESVTDDDRAVMAAGQYMVQEAVDAMLLNASEYSDDDDPFVVQSNKAAGDAAELYGLDREKYGPTVLGIAVNEWFEIQGIN